MLRGLIKQSYVHISRVATSSPRIPARLVHHSALLQARPSRFKMTSQAPDASTTTTAAVAEAAKANAGAAGSSENLHKDEVTGEMVSKR